MESSGGANHDSHFIVNNGDGSFTSDRARAPATLLHNLQPEYWRHQVGHLVDIDNDDDLDLALGQMRDLDPTHINQFSIVLVNDGTGHYRTRIELPHPDFNQGYTEAPGLTYFDVDNDGLQDLSATAPEYDSEGNPLYNDAQPRMHDVDLDGCADLVMAWSTGPVTDRIAAGVPQQRERPVRGHVPGAVRRNGAVLRLQHRARGRER